MVCERRTKSPPLYLPFRDEIEFLKEPVHSETFDLLAGGAQEPQVGGVTKITCTFCPDVHSLREIHLPRALVDGHTCNRCA